MYLQLLPSLSRLRRTPYGVRGLKLMPFLLSSASRASHPIRGAWIEMVSYATPTYGQISRTPYGVRGLKFDGGVSVLGVSQSHPIRGAWIEMPKMCVKPRKSRVAPHTGCVD